MIDDTYIREFFFASLDVAKVVFPILKWGYETIEETGTVGVCLLFTACGFVFMRSLYFYMHYDDNDGCSTTASCYGASAGRKGAIYNWLLMILSFLCSLYIYFPFSLGAPTITYVFSKYYFSSVWTRNVHCDFN